MRTQIKNIDRVCECCGEEFKASFAQVKKGGARFCSLQCVGIARKTKIACECLNCGRQFETFPSEIKRGGGKYCSQECFLATTPRMVLYCSNCGKEFTLKPSDVNRKRGKYCSYKCYNLTKPQKVTCICKLCGKAFTETQRNVERGRGQFCSHKCSNLALRGSGHPFWQGGSIKSYGENWNTQRKLARDRDGGVCQICHRKPKKGERRFQVHHIVKRRYFAKDDLTANDLSNLITLCQPCHFKVEHGKIAVPVHLL